jgi:hypothetical protein
MRAETRIVETEGTAVAKERPINAFARQRMFDTTIEELLETAFSIESAPRLYSWSC